MHLLGMCMVDSHRRNLLRGTALISSGLIAECMGSGQNGGGEGSTAARWIRDVSQEDADKLVISNLNQISGDPEIYAHY